MLHYNNKVLFGIKFFNKVSFKEEILKIARLKTPSRDQAAEMYIYTKGKYYVKNVTADEYESERTPGWFSKENPPEPRGTYTKTALEDSEWWCCDYAQLKQSGLDADKIVVASNSEIAIESNVKYAIFSGKFLIGSETMTGPVEVLLAESAQLVAITDVYGFKITNIGE